jgi:hypothetical protein
MTPTLKQWHLADGAASESNLSSAARWAERAGSLSERSGGSRKSLAQDDALALDLGYWGLRSRIVLLACPPIRSSARPCP